MDLCPPCAADLNLIQHACRCCGLPLEITLETTPLCGQCLRRPPPLSRVTGPYVYQDPLAYLIQALKFQQRLPVARLLGSLLARHLRQLPDLARPQAIIPVPLHPQRLKERGFNQALELARPIARELDIPLLQCCRRVRDTPAQMTLDARQRSRNLMNAFACTTDSLPEHVALVDDVMTTGHTLTELAHTLQRAGVKQVQAWVCARAL